MDVLLKLIVRETKKHNISQRKRDVLHYRADRPHPLPTLTNEPRMLENSLPLNTWLEKRQKSCVCMGWTHQTLSVEDWWHSTLLEERESAHLFNISIISASMRLLRANGIFCLSLKSQRYLKLSSDLQSKDNNFEDLNTHSNIFL